MNVFRIVHRMLKQTMGVAHLLSPWIMSVNLLLLEDLMKPLPPSHASINVFSY